MKKWLKQSLLLCLLAALLSSSVFAADTESGICDLNSHNGYQLIADGKIEEFTANHATAE